MKSNKQKDEAIIVFTNTDTLTNDEIQEMRGEIENEQQN